MTVLLFIKIFVYCIIILQIANKVGCKLKKKLIALLFLSFPITTR
jgi:hypothetical protein